jgi:hypothetical protein
MKASPLATEHFAFDGRGPYLARWLYRSDLLFDGTFWPEAPDGIHGVEYRIPPKVAAGSLPSTTVLVVDPLQCLRAWVVFDGLQVFQVVPEEVHTYWHDEADEPGRLSGVWEIADSAWLASFDPRHLGAHKHFVLVFYDDVVEVIARDLIFGHGAFSIDRVVDEDGRFAFAYNRRAQVREKAEDWRGALADYRAYASLEPNPSFAASGLRHCAALEKRLCIHERP